jgi:hypothetical protein
MKTSEAEMPIKFVTAKKVLVALDLSADFPAIATYAAGKCWPDRLDCPIVPRTMSTNSSGGRI